MRTCTRFIIDTKISSRFTGIIFAIAMTLTIIGNSISAKASVVEKQEVVRIPKAEECKQKTFVVFFTGSSENISLNFWKSFTNSSTHTLKGEARTVSVTIPGNVTVKEVFVEMLQDGFPVGQDEGHTTYERVPIDGREIPFGWAVAHPILIKRNNENATYSCTIENWHCEKSRVARLTVVYDPSQVWEESDPRNLEYLGVEGSGAVSVFARPSTKLNNLGVSETVYQGINLAACSGECRDRSASITARPTVRIPGTAVAFKVTTKLMQHAGHGVPHRSPLIPEPHTGSEPSIGYGFIDAPLVTYDPSTEEYIISASFYNWREGVQRTGYIYVDYWIKESPVSAVKRLAHRRTESGSSVMVFANPGVQTGALGEATTLYKGQKLPACSGECSNASNAVTGMPVVRIPATVKACKITTKMSQNAGAGGASKTALVQEPHTGREASIGHALADPPTVHFDTTTQEYVITAKFYNWRAGVERLGYIYVDYWE